MIQMFEADALLLKELNKGIEFVEKVKHELRVASCELRVQTRKLLAQILSSKH